ncbi:MULTISPECIES: TerC family protein [unclassified Thermoactinomyces]|uniref:TerC family protein n=1 Tax=unclassified Thermoactinomyces TaxID=2634588 RepID=UPI0018DD2AA6|nr:TerC family protein [Thermoactinomyces sp. CICC 10523]MBH8605097.1 TerC family protein [Thermoactinomyces sp. CICC 10522]
MEWLSMEFFTALLSIVVIDLVLAGDNAIVIGLAARNLPREQQKRVIFLGTAGAVVVRILFTLAVVWLLKVPGLLLAGGLILLWISLKLLYEEKDHGEVKAAKNMWAAVGTIVVADTVMGLDNVLGVAGAAHDSFLLVILGLLISVPIVVWGSTLFLKVIERFPWIIYLGSAVLAYTAARMITDEKFIAPLFEDNPLVKILLEGLIVVVILIVGKILKGERKKAADAS